MNEIVMIPIDLLLHHPENPRKDLGDLTELAESIKANGVMQNLTVVLANRTEFFSQGVKVEEEKTYFVVIGNRRMEAAKLAGLAELPCVISDMDHKTQVATMLMENMQRQDLTVYEQAQGFQMMMDLGYSAKEIGEKTGFSEKTVKDRIKFTKFNQKNFEKAVQQGATLMDMIEISKLESKSDQNEVMKHAGTENFRQKMKDALHEQEMRHDRERLARIFTEAGLEEQPESERTYTNKNWEEIYRYQHQIELKDKDEDVKKKLKKIQKNNEGPFRYYFTKWGAVEIYKPTKHEKKTMSAEEKTERQQAIARGKHLRYVKGFWAQAYELRKDFVKNYTVQNGTGASMIGKILVRYALNGASSWDGRLSPDHKWNDAYIREVLGLPADPVESGRKDPQYEWHKDYFTIWEQAEEKNVPVVRVILAWAVGGGVFWPDDPEHGLYGWTDGGYENPSNRDNGLTKLYEFLQEIGYEMSDMEKQLMDGTHACYGEEK